MGLIDLGKGVQPELEPGVSPVRAATLPTQEFNIRPKVFKQDLQDFYRIRMLFPVNPGKSCKSCLKNHSLVAGQIEIRWEIDRDCSLAFRGDNQRRHYRPNQYDSDESERNLYRNVE